jgi:hypothetical protein
MRALEPHSDSGRHADHIGPRFVDLCIADIRLFQVPNSERIYTDIKPSPSPRDKPLWKKPELVISGSMDVEQKSPVQPALSTRRISAHLPWAWLALAGVVTVSWAIALGWGAFEFIQWFFD